MKSMSSKEETNKMNGNESFFSKYLHLFWLVQQSRATVELNLSLSQKHPSADIHIAIHRYV